MDSVALDLLTQESTRLYCESQRVPDVLAGARGRDKQDRVPGYILAQGAQRPDDFQLPEPILHPFAQPDVLVVGYYPNYGEDEFIPRYGCSLDEYISFYIDRFAPSRRDPDGKPAHLRRSDGRNIGIRHYDVVEQLLDGALGTSQSLGTRAVYCDTLPWKHKHRIPFGSVDGGIAYHRLDRIVGSLQPRVVLTLGAEAKGVLVHRQPRSGYTNGTMLQVPLVISPHPAAYGGAFKANVQRVQQELARVLSTA